MKHISLNIKKTLSIVLSLAMIITAMPIMASAQDEVPVNDSTTSSTVDNVDSSKETHILYELEEERDSYIKHFRLSNGNNIAVQYPTPVNYKDENGKWVEYDNSMTSISGGEYYKNKSSNVDIKFANNTQKDKMIEIESGEYQLSWRYLNANNTNVEYKRADEDSTNKEVKLVNSKSVGEMYYSDIFNNTDIQCLSTSEGIKENIILKDKSAQNEFLFKYDIGNLTAVHTDLKTIELRDAEGQTVYKITAPYMKDADGTVSGQLSLEILNSENGKIVVKLSVDKDWLDDDSRTYPIVIDPTITLSVSDALSSARTVTSSTYYSSPLELNGNTKKVVMNYSLPSLDGACIEKATLNLFTSSSPNTPVNIKEVTQDNGGMSYTASNTVSDNLLCSYGSTNSFDVTKLVGKAYHFGYSSLSIEVSTTSTNTVTLNNSYISNDEMLIIEYNNFEGIDSNISYHTQDIGKAGTSYVNDITGNLLVKRTDIGFDGNVLPVSIDMIYNRHNVAANYLLAEPYGRGWNCGYYYRLYSMNSDDCDYYLVDASGRKIFFTTEDDETWEDEDGEGYELVFASTTSMLGAEITTPEGKIFSLDAYGRVIKIEDETFRNNELTNSINILYNGAANTTTGNRITRITDGVGRKYNFVYSSGRLSAINYVGTGTTTLSSVSYTYSQYLNSSIYRLTGVSYKGEDSVVYQSISYQYDSGSSLIKATDVDGYSVNFSGSNRVNSITETSANNNSGGTINIVYGYTNKTVFHDGNGHYEYMYFDTQGNVTAVRDEKGNAIFAEYGGRGQLNKVSDAKDTNFDFISDNNLLDNPDLTVSNIANLGTAPLSRLTDDWGFSGTSSQDRAIYAIGQEANPYYDASRVVFYGDTSTNKTMYQQIPMTGGQAGDEYSFGGWSIGDSLPLHEEIDNNGRVWGMTLEIIKNDNTAVEIGSFNYNPNESGWQYVRDTAVAPENYKAVRITVKYSNQANSAFFDGIELIKLGTTEIEEDNPEDPEDPEEPEGTTEVEPTFNNNGIKTYTTTSDSGLITNESVDRYENSVMSEMTDGTKSISTSNGYSSNGNYQTSQTDEAGNQTNYAYNAQTGLLASVTDANNTATNYTYNSAGQLTSSSCGNTTNSYTYDDNRLKSITTNSQSYYFEYDEWGNQTEVKVGQNENNAVSLIEYVYDSIANGGKLSNITYGNNQIISYTYDNEDKPTSVKVDGVTRYTMQYEYGELKSVTNVDTNTKIVYTEDGTEQWDLTSNHKIYSSSDTEEDGFVEDFYTDTFSRKATVNDTTSTTTVDYSHDNTLYAKQTLTYDIFNRLTQDNIKSGENSTTTQLNVAYTYRDVNSSKTTNQISSMTYTSNHSTLSGSNAKTISYTYDNLGNISSVTDSNGTTSYYYDAKGQLIRVDDAAQNATFTYSYNAAGNLSGYAKYSFGSTSPADMLDLGFISFDNTWKDKVTFVSGVGSITYDAIGNPLTYGSNTFTWTAGRQLASITNANNTITYKYDANGLRQQKTVNNATTKYIYSDDGKLLSQTDPYGNVMYFHYDEEGKPVGVNYYGGEYVYLKNVQGDIIGITTPSGKLVVEYTYDAWGKLLSVTGSHASAIGQDNPLRYKGYYYDTETGYYYLQSRYYNPSSYRFINADDTKYIGVTGTELSYNIFSYCENNAVNMIDIDGTYRVFTSKLSKNRIKVTINLTDKDIRNIRYKLQMAQIAGTVVSGVIGLILASCSYAVAGIICGVVGVALSTAAGTLIAQIDKYNQGKGARVVFQIKYVTRQIYVPMYKKSKGLYLKKYTISNNAYLYEKPTITWNK